MSPSLMGAEAAVGLADHRGAPAHGEEEQVAGRALTAEPIERRLGALVTGDAVLAEHEGVDVVRVRPTHEVQTEEVSGRIQQGLPLPVSTITSPPLKGRPLGSVWLPQSSPPERSAGWDR